jgi:hypothetical protein
MPTLIQTPDKLKRLLERNSLGLDKFGSFLHDDSLHVLLSKVNSRQLKDIICYNSAVKNWDDIAFVLSELKKFNSAITLKKLLLKYGDSEGSIRWNSYREKQKITNMFDYKQSKYGMTADEFKTYNKSRACTLDAFKNRYGADAGLEKWTAYCDRQSFTNSESYLGVDRYKDVNKRKGHSFESYLVRFKDPKLAAERLTEYFVKKKPFFSKISQELFTQIINEEIILKTDSYHFAIHNQEYIIYSNENKCVFFYDFVCTNLKFCIEFHGDHYHGNPILYMPNDTLNGRGCTNIKAKDKWKSDSTKIRALKEERNIDTVVVWESDYINDRIATVKKIKDYVKQIRHS